jgi:hypothetical protein
MTMSCFLSSESHVNAMFCLWSGWIQITDWDTICGVKMFERWPL